jgi:hypothetical protein
MRNQFVYTTELKGGTLDNPEILKLKDSFNINKVIRSRSLPTGELVVILDDFHTDWVITPISVNPNTDKVVKNKREQASVQSEIILNLEDAQRFFNRLSIDAL